MDIFDVRIHSKPTMARLSSMSCPCVDCSQQQLLGLDFWETYAPVVSWSTVCLMLLLSTILDLNSWHVDYTQAFPQAPLEDPVYMCLPQGWFTEISDNLQPHPYPTFNDTMYNIKLKRNFVWLPPDHSKLLCLSHKRSLCSWFQIINSGSLFVHAPRLPYDNIHGWLLDLSMRQINYQEPHKILSSTYLLEGQGKCLTT